MTSEQITWALAIIGIIVIAVVSLCLLARIDWAKVVGGAKRRRKIRGRSGSKKAKKGKEEEKKQPDVEKTVGDSEKDTKLTNGEKVEVKTTTVAKVETEKKVPKEVKAAEPSAPKVKFAKKEMSVEPSFMIFELSYGKTGEKPDNSKRYVNEKFSTDYAQQQPQPVPPSAPIKQTIQQSNPPANPVAPTNSHPPVPKRKEAKAKAKEILKLIDDTLAKSEEKFGVPATHVNNNATLSKLSRYTSADSIDEFLGGLTEANRSRKASPDLSLVMDEKNERPIFLYGYDPAIVPWT